MKYLIFISALLGSFLLYLLSSASANTELFSRNYYVLLALAGVLAVYLTVLVGYQLWQLRGKLKAQVFGAKLTLRLTLFFILIAILPGLLVYAVSVQFLDKSIESWFDLRVEKALEGGLNLGRNALETGLTELSKKGQSTALLLAKQSPEQYTKTLGQLIGKGSAHDAALFNKSGKLLAFASSNRKPPPDTPTAEMLREASQQELHSIIDTLPDNSLILRVLVLVKPLQLSAGARILQLTQPVPKQLAADAEMVRAVYRDYQELSLSRLGLKRLYGITLTLSLLIVLLSAVSAAFFISDRLSAPLAALAEGTRAVAQGDFSRQHPIKSRDELGALTGLFNQMTLQLADAKTTSEQQQRQAEDAKAYLESMLAHLSSGVLVVDEQFKLRSVNSSAAQILGASLLDMQDVPLAEIAVRHPLLRPFSDAIMQAFNEVTSGEWQRQIERLSKNGDQILLMRGTRLSTATDNSYVVVFDDITYLLQAERQAAWGEVARRLAHEIKNPLTPIQLSAERLQHKLSTKLDGSDAQLLQRATQTIVSQVAAMKNMVTEFADYARAPAPKLVVLDMHQLLREVLGLYEANSSPITLRLNATQTWVKGDATRLRQVIHNLLQNSYDALQNVTQREIILSTAEEGSALKLCVQDNGSGFPEHLLARAFEPYRTTKPKGTGLGLAIVKKIVEEHGGSIVIENVTTGGTKVSVTLPLLIEVA
ncbi:sensor histidine kinase [Candidatus Nitrotoga sp. AM1P]|uniref:sensor histidine kinase n=1 Tax=Candidatus Nitrotoga sp. AM1P TaxID=2559597 RepID=UPI0010BBD7C9|nr:ATP-binding protein [Candidatus Nitrotoga sp. AM1P]BBJ23720.1 putative sensor histidine kinase FleS [Candidatus Nitrotoga sp. AM1P]